MADKYDNWFAKVLNKIFGSGHEWAITLSKDCTRYSCSEEEVNKIPGWRAHEYVHKQQIAELGKFEFLCQYLWSCIITFSYKNNKFEVEARQKSGFPKN